jgi:hypothetical protein
VHKRTLFYATDQFLRRRKIPRDKDAAISLMQLLPEVARVPEVSELYRPEEDVTADSK